MTTVEMNQNQALALAKLIGCLEGLVEAGIFTHDQAELEVREILAHALAAFNLPSKTEREMPRAVQ